MGPTRRAALLYATTLPLTFLPAPTLAAEPSALQVQAARDLFVSATKDEDAQRWADALEKLRRVADVKLTAGVRYHIAFCEENLGQTATALAHYTEAQDAAEREHDEDVLALLTPDFFAGLRARAPALTIDVPGGIPGVEVTLDGRPEPKGLWGVAVPVDPGAHRVEAHAPGRVAFAKDMSIREREVTALDVVLPSIATAPPSAAPSVAAPPAESAPARTEAKHAGPSSHSLAAPIGTTVGAVVLAAGGVGAFVLAGNAQWNGQNQCAGRTSGGCDDLRTPVRDWDAVALGAWIGSAILTTTAIVLWASPPRPQSGSAARITTTGSLLVVEGSF